MNSKLSAVLKHAFSTVYGGTKENWKLGAELQDGQGRVVHEFKNEAANITLQVKHVEETPDASVYEAKQIGADSQMRLAVPKAWLN